MNMHTNVIAEAERVERSNLRDQLQTERLKAIRYRCQVKRLVWAMEGLCNRAEREGVDASYWRAMAAEYGEGAR